MDFFHKALDWYLWGLFMGLGWLCASGLAALIVQLFARAR